MRIRPGWKMIFSDVMNMKNLFFFLVLSSFLTLSSLALGNATDKGKTGSLRVLDRTICLNISDLKCLGRDTQFPPDVGKLYCLTRIVGAPGPTSVTHVWYFGDRERLRVHLAVKSANWRTYSSKNIRPREIGVWRVEILDPEGKRLAVCKFSIGTKNILPPEIVKHVEKSPRALPQKAPLSHRRSPDQNKISSRTTKTIGSKIALQMGGDKTDRLYVDLDHYTVPVVLVLGGASPKVAVHIMKVSFWDGPPKIPVNGMAVKQVRSSLDRASRTLRILLDLDSTADYDVKSYYESETTYCVEVGKTEQENEGSLEKSRKRGADK